jgi:hypothetical protein
MALQLWNNTTLASLVTTKALAQIVQPLYQYGIRWPLMYVYLYGPSFKLGFGQTFGFWNGVPVHDICAQKTGASSDHWLNNIEECQQLIKNDLHGLEVLLCFVIYISVLRWILYFALQFCASLPIMNTITWPIRWLWFWISSFHHYCRCYCYRYLCASSAPNSNHPPSTHDAGLTSESPASRPEMRAS